MKLQQAKPSKIIIRYKISKTYSLRNKRNPKCWKCLFWDGACCRQLCEGRQREKMAANPPPQDEKVGDNQALPVVDEDFLACVGSALPPTASSCHMQDSTSVSAAVCQAAGVSRGKNWPVGTHLAPETGSSSTLLRGFAKLTPEQFLLVKYTFSEWLLLQAQKKKPNHLKQPTPKHSLHLLQMFHKKEYSLLPGSKFKRV